jgi:predicted ATPase
MSEILVPVAPGELLDKITILRIKAERIADPAKLANVRHELALLEETWRRAVPPGVALQAEERELTRVNQALWEVEDAIREMEAAQQFDAVFIALARSVYRRNDERAALKRQVNTKLGSSLIEEKSYSEY